MKLKINEETIIESHKMKEGRKKFNPKYEYFVHYGIKLEYYDEEIADNLVKFIEDNYIVLGKVKDLGPNKYIDCIIHSDNANDITETAILYNIEDYSNIDCNIDINALPVPNLYKDDKYYFPDSDDLCSDETVEEMWNNSFVGYGDYDDNYPVTFNAFVRQCVESDEMKLVKWLDTL